MLAAVKKLKEEITTNKTETNATLDILKANQRQADGGASVKRPGSAITVDSYTLIAMQEQMEKMNKANLEYAEELKIIKEATMGESL